MGEQVLHTVVGLLIDFQSGLSLLPEFISTLYLLLTGTFLRLGVLSGSCTEYSLGLSLLGVDIGSIKNGKGIAGLDSLALLNHDLEYSAGYLARNAVLAGLGLSLNNLRLTMIIGIDTYSTYNDYHYCKYYE